MQRRAVEWVRRRLAIAFGEPAPPQGEAVETLVTTILSQNTTDVHRDRAYASLLRRFGSLDRVAQASAAEIEKTIRVAGLQSQKAQAIRDALRRVEETAGRLDLSFLARLAPQDAFAWLRETRGIGSKTAAIVLLFCFGQPYFPVDTHVARVLRRVGWIPARGDPFRHANAILPRDAGLMLDLHLLLIQLGRSLCRPRRPDCPSCPILARCEHGRAATAGA